MKHYIRENKDGKLKYYYSANGETVSNASVTFGGKYSLPSAPAKENAVFEGWYFNAEGTGVQVTANTVVTTTSDHTVYAVYKEYYKRTYKKTSSP